MKLEAVDIGRKARDRWLLSGISLSVQAGETVALTGPSGSGKTLLLRALAMLDPVDTGEVRWQGQTVQGRGVPEFRGRVMYMHQRPTMQEGTVALNLRQPFSLRVHRHKEFHRGRIVELLASLGRTEDFLLKQQRDLSGGERQLTVLLRAIQLDPTILLLDEPTAALDTEATEMFESVLKSWLQDQPDARGAVWVTHSPGQAARVATRRVEVHEGRLETSQE